MSACPKYYVCCIALVGMANMAGAQSFDFAMTESMRVAQEVTTQLALMRTLPPNCSRLPWQDACLALERMPRQLGIGEHRRN